MTLPKAFSRRAYQFFLIVHLWLGLGLGIWLILIGLTGSLLAWMPELTSYEAQRRYPLEYRQHNSEQFVPLSQALSAIKEAYPDMTAKELSRVQMPTGRYPYFLLFRRTPEGLGILLTDPYTAKVHPLFLYDEMWMGKVNLFHTALLAGVPGILGNGILSLLALVLLLSGLWMWWPSTLKQLKDRITLPRGASVTKWLRDLHNVLAIYLYAILFVTTLTSVLLVVNKASRNGIEIMVNKRAGAEEVPVQITPGKQRIDVDRLVTIASEAVPHIALDSIKIPLEPDEPFQAQFLDSGFLGRSVVSIDPYSGQVVDIEQDRQASPGHQTVALIQDLHFGFFGGIWSKLLYTIAGILPLGLFITGTLMWWRKRTTRTKKKRKNAAS